MDRNFARLVDLLALLPRKGSLDTTQLRQRLAARGHDVTARTVQRDLEGLAQVYPIECDACVRPYAWHWRATAPGLSVPGMDWPEAVSFHLLHTYLEGMLPGSVTEALQPYLQEARRLLAQRFHDLPLRHWPQRVRLLPPGPPLILPRVSRAVHEAVTEAVLLGRQLRLSYRAFDREKARSYVVSPLGLVQVVQGLYVPVRFEGHDDVRTLRLHRVQRAELLPGPSGIERFDLQAWIDAGALGFGGSERIRLVARFFDNAGELVREAALSLDQVIEPDGEGRHRVEATVVLTAQLKRWLLGLGARVEVLEPPTLRRDMAQSLQAAVARYTPLE
ncbi:helix-turn-helix transcriptional regulator [Azohydromonas aeria]|uniref:helix-turn-helix transcriptional regulator n=1 Tax=Azohydromonas aeria TaxID=2590212 RepID=UPI0012FAA315|nr:WYL domain-containing protein [Azohydromonas aeria]